MLEAAHQNDLRIVKEAIGAYLGVREVKVRPRKRKKAGGHG
jgi:hypothetical protein